MRSFSLSVEGNVRLLRFDVSDKTAFVKVQQFLAGAGDPDSFESSAGAAQIV